MTNGVESVLLQWTLNLDRMPHDWLGKERVQSLSVSRDYPVDGLGSPDLKVGALAMANLHSLE
jgi:hypothetical protein